MKNKSKLKFFFFIFLIAAVTISFFIIIFPFTKLITYLINNRIADKGCSFAADDIDYVFPAGIEFENAVIKHLRLNLEFTAKNTIIKPSDFFSVFDCSIENFVFQSGFGRISLDKGNIKYSLKSNKVAGDMEYFHVGTQSGWSDVYLTYLFGDKSPELLQKELYFEAEVSNSFVKILKAVSEGVVNFNLNTEILFPPHSNYNINFEGKLSDEFINKHPLFCYKLERLRRIKLDKTISISIKSNGGFSLKNMIIRNI